MVDLYLFIYSQQIIIVKLVNVLTQRTPGNVNH